MPTEIEAKFRADDDAPLNGTADEHDDEDDAREREHMEERA